MLTLASLTLSIIVLSGVLGYGIARQFLPKEQAFFFGAMQVGVLLYPHFLGVFSYIGLPGKYSFVLAVPMILFSARTAWKDYSLAFIKELYFWCFILKSFEKWSELIERHCGRTVKAYHLKKH